MKKLLVLLLCLFVVTGMMTTASISAQRNAWKKEAERAMKERDKITEEYDAYQLEADEKIASLTTERDAYALLTHAMEEENTRLNAELSLAQGSLQDLSACMEERLNQANADKAWAEQRLQEALDILLTPAPSLAPAVTPAVPEKTMEPEERENGEAPEETDASEAAKIPGGLTDSVWEMFSLTLPPSPSPSPSPTPAPSPDQQMQEQEETEETADLLQPAAE
ncbi:MAG: hypothetical protein IJD39_01075 [Clostridia bacterium]|nr:hypothetical protein [Clostridia bacterium]